MQIKAGAGRFFSASPVAAPSDSATNCDYEVRLWQAGDFVTKLIVHIADVPQGVSEEEQHRLVFDALANAVNSGPREADLLALRVEQSKLAKTPLVAAAHCGYGAAQDALKILGTPLPMDSGYCSHPARDLLAKLWSLDRRLAIQGQLGFFRSLYLLMPDKQKSETIPAVLATIDLWIEHPFEESVTKAKEALGLFPPSQTGRWRPEVYLSLERFVKELSSLGTEEDLVYSMSHLMNWAASADLPYRYTELEKRLLPAVCDAVLSSALGYPAKLPIQVIPDEARYEVVTQIRDHGDVYELEHDTTYFVVDRTTKQAVLEFRGTDFSTYNGTWEYQYSTGVSFVALSEDGRSVRVKEAGIERVVPIPGAPSLENKSAPEKPGRKRRGRRRKKQETLATPSGPKCPRCSRCDGTRCVQTDLLEGSLEYYYLVHTEVREHFHCDHCNTEWSDTAYL